MQKTATGAVSEGHILTKSKIVWIKVLHFTYDFALLSYYAEHSTNLLKRGYVILESFANAYRSSQGCTVP